MNAARCACDEAKEIDSSRRPRILQICMKHIYSSFEKKERIRIRKFDDKTTSLRSKDQNDGSSPCRDLKSFILPPRRRERRVDFQERDSFDGPAHPVAKDVPDAHSAAAWRWVSKAQPDCESRIAARPVADRRGQRNAECFCTSRSICPVIRQRHETAKTSSVAVRSARRRYSAGSTMAAIA